MENNIMVDAYVCPMSRYVKYVHDCPLAFGDVGLGDLLTKGEKLGVPG